MSDVKFSAQWALLGVLICFIVFGLGFWVFNQALPGYKMLAYPGIVATRFFSEEINFWPKLSIMLTGQYIAYFLGIYSVRKIMAIRSKG